MKGLSARAFALPLVLMAVAILLGIAATSGVTAGPDKAALSALAMREGATSASLITLVQWITWFGDQAQRSVLMVLAALFLWWRKRPKAALVMAIAPVLASVTSSVLKEVYARPRPSLVPHLDHVTNLSFPSGHAVNAVAVFVLAALLIPVAKRGMWLGCALLAATLICVSRMLLGVHYPTDVLGGVLIGTAFALAGVAIARAIEAR